MEGLKGILENPMVKTLLLKQLKKAWRENKLQLITITEIEGELTFEVYAEEMVVISRKDFNSVILFNDIETPNE